MGIGQDHIERNREDGSDDENLKHKVIESRDEERKPRLCLDLLSIIVSKLLSSFREVLPSQADLDVDLQLVADTFDTYKTEHDQRRRMPRTT